MQYTMNHARAIAQRVMVVSMLGLCLSSTGVYAQGLTWLGTLGGTGSTAYGVSADGSVVVGYASYASGYYHAFRWTASGGMQDLGTLGGGGSVARGVSADGSVVVGYAFNTSRVYHAFRWTAPGGMQDLGTLGGNASSASGVSADGSVVVGYAYNTIGFYRAFRWESGVMQDLGTLPGGGNSSASGVSADGSVVVGGSYEASGYYHAFRWTASGGMQDLGTLGGTTSASYGVSADGSVVVGGAQNASRGYHAFRWTASRGMENLNSTFAPLLTDGSYLAEARAISPDGRYIVGWGYNAATGREEAFLLDTFTVVPNGSVMGNVVLRDFTGDITLVPVTVQLRRGGITVRTETLFLDARGNYTIPDVEPGTYSLAFKASHWLQVVRREVEVVAGGVTYINVSLTNGDIDGDNEVTLFDFGALVSAFGSMPGDGNWNPEADLDGDEEVTLFDFGILVSNFGAIGDD